MKNDNHLIALGAACLLLSVVQIFTLVKLNQLEERIEHMQRDMGRTMLRLYAQESRAKQEEQP